MPGFINGIQIFPSNNVWNVPISSLPVHAQSGAYISWLNRTGDCWLGIEQLCGGAPFPFEGFPFSVVDSSQATVSVTVTGGLASVSDFGQAPIPSNAPIEGYTGDNHVIVIDSATKMLYEMWKAVNNGDGTWSCQQSSQFDLTSNTLRTNTWPSADAAGLPIFPGLIRYDELITQGSITHALRGIFENTHDGFLWPARHDANNGNPIGAPPMGLRFRLKASFDISGFSAINQTILACLKTYGLFVADNTGNSGSFGVCGSPDTRFTRGQMDAMDNELFFNVHLSNFEAVDCSSLQVSADSGQAYDEAGHEIQMVYFPSSGYIPGVPGLFSGGEEVTIDVTSGRVISRIWRGAPAR